MERTLLLGAGGKRPQGLAPGTLGTHAAGWGTSVTSPVSGDQPSLSPVPNLGHSEGKTEGDRRRARGIAHEPAWGDRGPIPAAFAWS